MSLFQVKLNNAVQGNMDVDMLTGSENTTSIQRTMDVCGPNRIQRHLIDGQQFTDCNYWKQFAYPAMSLDQAFIVVLTDDGSVYSPNPEENTFPVVWLPGTAGVIGAGIGPAGVNMALNVVATYGGPAQFVQIQNTDASHSIKVKLNGSTNAVFTLGTSSTQIFNHDDLIITKIEFDNSASGTSAVNAVDVILSVQSIPTS